MIGEKGGKETRLQMVARAQCQKDLPLPGKKMSRVGACFSWTQNIYGPLKDMMLILFCSFYLIGHTSVTTFI